MTVAVKKYKLFKVCKELNVGIDTISSFLSEKGIKVQGPNTSFPEEIYSELLEKFAREKEIADKLHERKSKIPGEVETLAVEEKEELFKKPTYVQAIERSIEERLEEIAKEEEEAARSQEEEKNASKKKKEIAEKEPDKKFDEGDAVVEQAIEIIEEKTPVEEEVLPVDKTPVDVEEKQTDDVKKEISKEKVVVAEVDSKPKKGKDKEERRKEKEDKRRKAYEMIRKEDKRRKQLIKSGKVGELDTTASPKTRKPRRKAVDQKEVEETVKKTLASIDERLRKPKRRKKIKEDTGEIVEENVIYASEFISANDLANLIDVSVSEIITKCLELGLAVSINQRLDIDTIELLANEWGYTVIKEEEYASDLLEEMEGADSELVDDEPRAPIITIMGHVDHGKTSLLDFIRKTNVVKGESGGITQHIGAYEVVKKGKHIAFLDTPGHEAFTAMRARGAQVTDIVILVIAADDSVKPQTDEAIDHARAAGVKIMIAINKIDKPDANPEKIRKQLADRNILVEDWGGNVQCAEVSASTGAGIDELLEKVLLEAEMLDLKANSKKKAVGTVIESKLDRGKGIISNILVQNGTLHIGDNFLAGQYSGKVRALLDENFVKINKAGPSQPVQVVGFDGLPQAGDKLLVLNDEKTVKEISIKRQRIKREQDFRQQKLLTLDQISENIKLGGLKELRIIVKADVDGSAEALSDSLLKLSTKEVTVNVIRKAVGTISESDVLLALASNAIIIGFHVRPNVKANELAARETIDIRIYKVVYDAIEEIRLALEGLLGTEKKEQVVGTIEVRETFKISRIGTIAGCHVKSGKISRNSKVRLIRDDVELYDGNLSSLKRFKEDVKEVLTGFECGIQIQNYNDIKVGDNLEVYEIVETKRTLESS
jgi:translation initiation factor IF-2